MKQQFKEEVSPAAFKTEVSFVQPQDGRIYVPVYFEKANVTRMLLFDTHAPFSINNSIVDNSAGEFSFVSKSNIPKKTPDGRSIDNNFYLTDGVKFGNVRFDHVMVNGVPETNYNDQYPYDGIFGDNLLSEAVWKIDFEHKTITMASSIDSISGLKEARVIPSTLSTTDKFKIKCEFDNNVRETMKIDLGYNGHFVMPKKDFDKIDNKQKAVIKKGEITTLAGTKPTNFYILDNSMIKLGTENIYSNIRSNDFITKKYIGVGFFSKYKFIVLDYLNKKLYISNEKLEN